MSDANYELVDQFYIDNGELDEISPHVCFVLGVKWHQVVSAMDANPNESLSFTVLASNKDRLEAAILRRKRECRWKWPSDDRSEEWVYVDISGVVHD